MFTADAQARALTPNTWLRTTQRGPIRDQAASDTDRRYELEWADIADLDGVANDYQLPQYRTATLVLSVGYIYGPGAKDHARLLGNETAMGDAINARRRALGDAERIKRALVFPDIFLVPGSDPALFNIARDGASACEDLGDGRLLCVTRYRIEFQYQANTAYTP